jgi:glycosyltransferase involved in cell wall biosynthesis
MRDKNECALTVAGRIGLRTNVNMKVVICKFFNEKGVERKVSKLVDRKKKRATNLRVFCSNEHIRKRLESEGIVSEVLYDFYRIAGPEDEPGWEKVYELSDRLHSSAENDNRLKYHGINFLTLEYSPIRYLRGVKLSRLCQEMAQQNCDVLVIVLTEPLSMWLPDMKSRKIRTVKYTNPIEALRRTRLLSVALPRVRPQSKGAKSKGSSAVSTATNTDQAGPGQKALFVVSPPLYSRPAAAIINECLRNGLKPNVATDDPASAAVFRSHSIEYSAMPMLKASYPIKVLPLYYRLRKLVRNRLSAESDDFSAAYLCTKALMADLLPLCYLAISSVDFVDRMIKVASPDIMCLMPDGFFLQRMAAALAKRYDIPTLSCSAAIETGNSRSQMRHLYADKKAAMGEIIKNLYIESGVDPERIVITGVAHFDQLFNRNKEQDKQVLAKSGIDPNEKTILFTTDNITLSETKEMLTGVISAVLKMNDVQLVIKVHPREDAEPYQEIAKKYRDSSIHVVKDTDLYALISNCELLVTKFSTTALEAMMVDKPVVTINLSGQPTPVPYAEEGAALGVFRHEDIEQAIQKALYDEETRYKLKAGRDKFVRRWAGEPDGKAAQRIVMLMKGMIAASAKHSKGAA